MAEKQPVFELAIGTKQKIADGPIVAFFARAVDVGQHHAIVVDQLRADDGRECSRPRVSSWASSASML